jgi:hypothetical protein
MQKRENKWSKDIYMTNLEAESILSTMYTEQSEHLYHKFSDAYMKVKFYKFQ